MTTSTPAGDGTAVWPSIVSYVFGPVPMGVCLSVGIGIISDDHRAVGAGWGLLAVAFAAVLPAGATRTLRRRNRAGPGGRRARITYLSITSASAATGLLILHFLGAPREVAAVAAALALGLVVALIANLFVNASNHVAAVSGGATIACALYGPQLAWLYLIAVLVAVARVRAAAHTWPEVLTGAALGALAGAMAPLLAG